jgi:LmbE family N-acetylglucosaminyl deacetylase
MKTIVIAPHPDDEVLGAGGTLLRRKAEGGEIAWLLMTSVSETAGWSAEKVSRRAEEIRAVKEFFKFDEVFSLEFPATQLDQIPTNTLVSGISAAFNSFQPEEVIVPHPSDIHSDHRIVFNAVASCTKWFRYPSVRRVLAYETLSETDFSLGTDHGFCPTVFVDIGKYIDDKLRAMDIYSSELGAFPFPRSHQAIRALATVRGAASGFTAAEAFQLLRERL